MKSLITRFAAAAVLCALAVPAMAVTCEQVRWGMANQDNPLVIWALAHATPEHVAESRACLKSITRVPRAKKAAARPPATKPPAARPPAARRAVPAAIPRPRPRPPFTQPIYPAPIIIQQPVTPIAGPLPEMPESPAIPPQPLTPVSPATPERTSMNTAAVIDWIISNALILAVCGYFIAKNGLPKFWAWIKRMFGYGKSGLVSIETGIGKIMPTLNANFTALEARVVALEGGTPVPLAAKPAVLISALPAAPVALVTVSHAPATPALPLA